MSNAIGYIALRSNIVIIVTINVAIRFSLKKKLTPSWNLYFGTVYSYWFFDRKENSNTYFA